ncbi:MAG: hypothetical protein HZB36_04805 [Candidatus Omnitrophica bacterium]|nr:hypothetical protein [Candidatus Omnitrophota bacterium]
MKKLLFMCFITMLILVLGFATAHAKSMSLQEIEGDRKVLLKIDKKAKMSKPFLKRKQAQDYIVTSEDLKKRVTGNLYTGENVIRHDKSPRFQNLSDGIIFNTGGGKIGYAKRKDGSFIVIIDYPTGRKLRDVNEAVFDEFANVINDDCTVPYVFFDKEGQEAAIVYFPSSMVVSQYLTQDGLVAIEASERI